MKLTSRVLALAALVATALLGSTSAGVVDGPCTITGDMSTQEGSCPAGFDACLAFVRLAPQPDSSTPTVIVPVSCPTPTGGTIITSITSDTATVIGRLSTNYFVQVVGVDKDNIAIGVVTETGGVCGVRATVTSGTCLYSDRSPSSSSVVSGAASAVLAAAAAGAALLLA